MGEFFHSIKKSYIFTSILYIIGGIALIIFSTAVTNIIWYIFAVALMLFGLVRIIDYFTTPALKNLFGFSLVTGLLMIALGIYIFVSVETFKGFIPFIFGFIAMFAALIKLQQSVDLGRSGYKNWWTVLIFAVLLGVLATLILFDPFGAADIPVILIGVTFIINGIADIWAMSKLTKVSKAVEDAANTVVIENDENDK